MSTLLIVSGALVWWFVGLVSSQLLWREVPVDGSFRQELGPAAHFIFFVLSFTGILAAGLYLSGVTVNKIEERQARKQVRDAMVDEKNKLILKYHERLMEQEGLGDIAKFDPSDAEIQ